MTLYLLWNIYDLFRKKPEDDALDNIEEVKSFDETCISYLYSFHEYLSQIFSSLPIKDEMEGDVSKLSSIKKTILQDKRDFKVLRDRLLSDANLNYSYEKRRIFVYIKECFNIFHEVNSSCYEYVSDSKVFSKEQVRELQKFSSDFSLLIEYYAKNFSKLCFTQSDMYDKIIQGIRDYEQNDYHRSRSKYEGFSDYYDILDQMKQLVRRVNNLRERLQTIHGSEIQK
jgi:hypothetical protein